MLDAFDEISVPIGIHRGFRYLGEGKGVLLTLIGGPDAERVAWHPGVLKAAGRTGCGSINPGSSSS